MGKTIKILAGLLAVVVAVAATSLFIVDETQIALVLQLGKAVGEPRDPGLHFKIPLVQSIVYYDTRYLDYDAEAREVITKDKKNLLVDNYARWRIVDPLLFYQTVRDINGAQSRLDDTIYSELRKQLGKYDLLDIVAMDRSKILQEVILSTSETAKQYGIDVVDVRIKRADLPPANEKAVYARMQAERIRQAQLYRAEGEEAAAEIRSTADKEKSILLADAFRVAEELRGKGDAEAARIYAEAFGKDAEFYGFVKSLDVYKKSIKSTDTLVLTAEGEFFKYLKTPSGGR